MVRIIMGSVFLTLGAIFIVLGGVSSVSVLLVLLGTPLVVSGLRRIRRDAELRQRPPTGLAPLVYYSGFSEGRPR